MFLSDHSLPPFPPFSPVKILGSGRKAAVGTLAH